MVTFNFHLKGQGQKPNLSTSQRSIADLGSMLHVACCIHSSNDPFLSPPFSFCRLMMAGGKVNAGVIRAFSLLTMWN